MRAPHPIITFLGHASFKVVTPAGRVVLVDPWLERNPACPPEHKRQDKADLILVTHGHDDHLDEKLPELVAATGAIVVAPPDVRGYLQREGVTGFELINKGGTVEVCGLKVTMTLAFHASVVKAQAGGPDFGPEAVGYVLETEGGFCVYFAGDTALFGDMRLIGELYRPDVAVLPIGDRFTMGPREAAFAARLLGVRRVIPMHYGSFPGLTGTPERLREALGETSEVEVIELRPGESLSEY